MAGKTWYYGFMLRHPSLSLRTPEQTSINRVRSFCKENVLTSPELVATLKDRKEKSDAAKKKKEDSAKKRKGSPRKETPKKRTQPSRAAAAKKKSSSTSDEDVDFCMICMQNLPAKLTSANSIECNKCKRPFHLKCVHLTRSYFTCQNCDSDADLSE
ncbi:uncharacterized protein LOC116346566 [Contarinia nasturtii]|uniref:uncharacterized protein LOC116346566 n=1 Tax=Contarinia nasturtii TaxID=265458 RepID=UPI0012D49251|nr:uncharacterized protein LOC116346566 [Contarinia nasturtii]